MDEGLSVIAAIILAILLISVGYAVYDQVIGSAQKDVQDSFPDMSGQFDLTKTSVETGVQQVKWRPRTLEPDRYRL